MSTYLQAGRAMSVTTPLGPDVLLLQGFEGEEALSRPFRFTLELTASDPSRVAFDRVLGRKVTVDLAVPDGRRRYFSGICASLVQMARGPEFTPFRMEVVPHLHLLTLRTQSRIFQNLSVPEILRKVLSIPDVVYDLAGTYQPRDYCVQYREADADFAARLMEEEGIYYSFRHNASGHQMVVSDRTTFPPLEPDDLTLQPLEDSMVDENRITRWEKAQHLRSGKISLRDHTFELPHQNLESESRIPDTVTVGRASHALRIGNNDALEVYDWPGTYAQRFDGVDRGGGLKGGELAKVFDDGRRTAGLRMQAEAAEAIAIRGASRYRHLSAGQSFALAEQSPDPFQGGIHDGRYVLVSLRHEAQLGDDYRSGGGGGEALYENQFTCLPAGLPFRPRRTTPKPIISGTQTAVVVGPPGEEIHTDLYGRVKVQFHWDRQGKYSDDSSCWVRVAQIAAGGGFGGIHIPRVGQEVVVQFEEGDPDRPIIVGCVYNPNQMPPYTLPAGKMISGLRSNTYPHGGGLNEITVDDSKGKERMFFHAQYNQDVVVGNDHSERIGRDETHRTGRDRYETVVGTRNVVVQGEAKETVKGVKNLHVGGDLREQVDGSASLAVGADQAIQVAREVHVTAGTRLILEAGATLTIKGPGGFVEIGPAGITIEGTMVNINSGGAPSVAGAVSPQAPADAKPV